jgi:glyoxylase-like metal-dependent hydrolase (beta-lactamase superfamily II)
VRYDRGVHEIGDGVWAYLQPDGSWGWSNAGLIASSDGATSLLVDTLFDVPLTQRMLDELRAATSAADEIGVVVNTHANGDHCWGNELVAGAEIVASAACAEEMAELPPDRLVALKEAAPQLGDVGEYVARIFGPFDFASIHVTLPTRTFTGALDLDVGGDRTVRLHEVGPAHTRGDVLVEVPDAGVVFTGDILFVGGHPIVWAGPLANWVSACDRLLAMDVDTVVPGHGPVADKDAVRTERDYFVELEREARVRHAAGMSALEAARDLHASDTRGWGEAERLAVNVAAVYGELGADVDGDVLTLFSAMAELALSPRP